MSFDESKIPRSFMGVRCALGKHVLFHNILQSELKHQQQREEKDK